MLAGDTIVAIASPPGRSPRGIVRLSGPRVRAALRELVDPAPHGAGVSVVRFRLDGDRSLSALLLFSAAPRSYTGEDSAEITLPGSPALLQRVVARCVALPGVRAANPGEFSARAFLAGRLSVEQAEGVAAVIAAENDEQLDAARRILLGATGARHRALADDLTGALALVEAGIDFTDQEDVVAITPRALHDRLIALSRSLDELLGPRESGAPAADHTPRVVLMGRSNAGKSTLFNALLGRPRAAVSPEPGATRDALEETLDLSAETHAPGTRVTLIDLAGLDASLATRGPIDAAAQRAARGQIERADVVLHCDPRAEFDALIAPPSATRTLRVRTMADLPHVGSHGRDGDALSVCAIDGWNLAALRRAIADAATHARAGAASHVWPRHRVALAAARKAIDDALSLVEPQRNARALANAELIADPLRRALDALGEISGRITPDDVLGRVFASFCVGK